MFYYLLLSEWSSVISRPVNGYSKTIPDCRQRRLDVGELLTDAHQLERYDEQDNDHQHRDVNHAGMKLNLYHDIPAFSLSKSDIRPVAM